MSSKNKTRQSSSGTAVASAYEDLFVFNLLAQRMDDCIHRLKTRQLLRKENARYYRLMLNEARAYVSQDVVERLSQLEIRHSAETSNERLLIEKKFIPK